jgi:hypothetical protein
MGTKDEPIHEAVVQNEITYTVNHDPSGKISSIRVYVQGTKTGYYLDISSESANIQPSYSDTVLAVTTERYQATALKIQVIP